MAHDLTGMMAGLLPEQGVGGSTDLARALTVLQVGIEILTNGSARHLPDLDSGQLTQTLAAATERVAGALAALVESDSPGAPAQ